MSVTLEVPNEVTQAMRLPPPEAEARLRLELAIGLYTQRLLPLGKAALLAGLSRWELEDILGRRGVPAHYTEEALIQDAAYADRRQ
jgi:predicted HTH domain antitoxin